MSMMTCIFSIGSSFSFFLFFSLFHHEEIHLPTKHLTLSFFLSLPFLSFCSKSAVSYYASLYATHAWYYLYALNYISNSIHSLCRSLQHSLHIGRFQLILVLAKVNMTHSNSEPPSPPPRYSTEQDDPMSRKR